MSTEERRIWAVYIPPLTHTMDCNITGAPHVQSHWCTFNRSITWSLAVSYLTPLVFIVQHLHIYTRYVAKLNAFASHNHRFRSIAFCTNNFFNVKLYRQQYRSKSQFFDRTNILSLQLVRKLWKSLTINALTWKNDFVPTGFKV